jgi:hypothetical protein
MGIFWSFAMSLLKLAAAVVICAALPAAAFAQAAKPDPAKPAADANAKDKDKDKDKPKEKLICERVTSVDSSIGTRVCKTQSQIKAEQDQASRSVDAINREVTLPSQMGSGRAAAFGNGAL